ncbi:MAG TPA: hypothetical protein VFL16_11745 [Steroidobacteraceae bacterium]|nr:hypothetical protein [Steroidobacteraceae bacterium]
MDDPPHKAFVRAYLDQSLPDAFEEGVVAAVQHDLHALGIEVQAVTLDGLETDRHAHERARAEFEPEVVLVVSFHALSTSGFSTRAAVEMTLLDAHDEALWGYEQHFDLSASGRKGLSRAGQRVGNAAVQRLVDDRVFPGPV